MCSPASFETAYVQRASPTEPIVVTLPSRDVERVRAEDLARRELDEALERVLRRERSLERVVGADHVHAHRPHRAREHGVDAGDRRAVDDVRRAAGELDHRLGVEHVALAELEVRVVGEIGAGERVAVEVVDARRPRCRRPAGARASSPMKPAPPVIRIFLPSSAIAEARRRRPGAEAPAALASERANTARSSLVWRRVGCPRFTGARGVFSGDPDDHRVAARADERVAAFGPSAVSRRAGRSFGPRRRADGSER